MSSSNINSSNNIEHSPKDFEFLYNDLKQKYSQYLQESEEMYQEYEETISLLTLSINEMKSKNSLNEQEINEISIENEKVRKSNKEKIKEISDINKKNEILLVENEKIKEEKKLLEKKIVKLENVNENYISKMRQDEALIDELNLKIEAILEENIILNSEFEIYKQETEEEFKKKNEVIAELKNELLHYNIIKNKIIYNNSVNKSDSFSFSCKKKQKRKIKPDVKISSFSAIDKEENKNNKNFVYCNNEINFNLCDINSNKNENRIKKFEQLIICQEKIINLSNISIKDSINLNINKIEKIKDSEARVAKMKFSAKKSKVFGKFQNWMKNKENQKKVLNDNKQQVVIELCCL